MKFSYLLFFIYLLSVDAQRRSVKSELLSENEPQPKTARRGRARFTLTSETPQIEEPKRPEVPSRRLSSRRRPETTPVKINKSYEVEEIVDETPLETLRRPKSKLFVETPVESVRKHSSAKSYTEAKFEEFPVESIRRPSSAKLYTEAKFHETPESLRRPTKSRVLTETKYEAQNAPTSNALFQPSTTENLDEIIKSIGEGLDTTSSSVSLSSTLPSSLESLSSEITASEITKPDNDISRTQPETTTPITSRTTRRSNGRARSNTASPTVASRVRSRTRATRRPEEPSSTPTAGRTVHRGARRRNEPSSVESRTRGPSVIQTAETVETPTRSRNGRRTPGTAARRNEEVTVPEKVTLDLPQSRRLGSRKSVETTTFRSRTRTRSRDIPPIIDEQKLEVLPLFERESKTVKPLRNSRRRNINSAEEVETSATENDIKIAPKPPKESVVVATRTESTIKRRKIISKVSRRSSTSKPTVQTSKPTVQTPKPTIATRKPVVKESVISEVSEVTSKRTVSRQNKLARAKTETPKFVQRGTKKSEIKLTNVVKNKSSVTSSEEEIDDSDNYPEQFKALLQAKKQKKESRSQHRLVTAAPAVTKTTEKVVNSSPSSTTPVIASEASRQQLEESENELVPRKVQPGRRFTQTTEKATRPTRKSKVVRSTTIAPSTSTREHRFHAKFNTEPEATTSNPVKSARSLPPKPPRGLYSSRKTKESYTKNKSPSGQIPTPKKSNRYSSRYRNDAAARGAIRTSTNAPAYLPTIPTITPPTTLVKSSYRDKDLGVEVISFDDPVNTVPSANLVSGEYLASSTESHLTSPLVNWQNNKFKTETEKNLFLKVSASQTKTTEKPFSIIESIINSITAISTTEAPDPTKLTFSTDDPTKQSAILKLATKKPTKLDKTQTTQIIPVVTVTSEKPTTIIERILSSLSAIQADNTTDTKKFKSKQVGSNFNTISSPSTTPITRVTKSTLSAQYSTTVNPLTVLDEISNEQTLQKRTIGKLLALLNTLTSTTPRSRPTQLVVVTPKATNYVVGTSVVPTSAIATSTTIEPILSSTITTTTTTEPTTTSTTTTTTTTSNQLFTSPSPGGVSINSRAKPPESTTMRYTTTPTYTTLSTLMPPTTTMNSLTTLSRTEAVPTTMTPKDISNEIGALPLSFETGGSTTPSTTTDSSLSISTTLPSTESSIDTETGFVFPSTLPALVNFEVSPGSVSIFSANDLSNVITPEDGPSTTVTIPGRTNLPETDITTQTSTDVTTPIQTTTPFPNSADSNAKTQTSVTLNSRIASTDPSTTPMSTTVPSATEAPSTTTQNPTTTDSSTTTMAVTNTSSQDISSNVIDTTGSPEKSNTSTVIPLTNITSRTSGRSGRLLNVVQDSVQNSIENTTSRDKDYYIFAVLNNNTVLRKRPSRFPNKETPFLIVGVYPNNTIVRKFPNGSFVPMEPVIRVSGFDTRENPPPLPEITSNQVTPDQGSRPDNKNLQTVEQNTIPPIEANPLSISTVNNPPTTGTTPSSTVQANPLSISSSSSTSTTESSTSRSTSTSRPAPVSTTSATTTSSTTSAATLPTLTEILTGRTGKAFNSIINISDLTKVETLKVDPKTDFMSTTPPSPTLSNRILDNPSTMPPMTLPPTIRLTTMPPTMLPPTIRLTTTPTTTSVPTTTPVFTTTTMPPTTTPIQTRRPTTIPPFTQPVTSSFQTTAGFPTSTFFPQFLTTLFSTIRPRRVSTTEAPITIVTPISNRIQPVTSPRVDINTNGFDLTTAGSTRRPTAVDLTTGTTRRVTTTTVPTTLPFTVPISTTVRSRRRGTTTTIPTTTTILTTTTTTNPPTTRMTSQRNARRGTTTEATTTTTNATKRLRQLTEQQRKDLEAIAQLEREQAAILRQLAFLTNLNIGGNTRTTTDRTDLAKRIVALAVERDKDRPKPTTTTLSPEITTAESKREAKKISVSSDQSLEEIVKQFNIVTPSPITTEYGKSNDAIIAALLKEQGIGPTTPKVLEDVYSHTTTTTKRPKPTTRPPGPLMQSLNWLLNVLAPQPTTTTTTTTKRPKPKTKSKPKPKPKPKPQSKPDEILTHQPTHITPVVTAAPRRNLVSSLSQQDIQKLIRQLENIQKDPANSQELDFSQIKSLQALLNSDEGVQVTSSGSTGATSRPNTTPLTTAKRKSKGRVAKSTTAVPLSVSNSIADDEEFVSTTTTRSRVSLPPVRLRPVPGIEDGDTMVRGQLITAAVNVTRAISSFLGTALQDAAQQVSRLFANGSANFRDYLGSSSVLANVSNFTAASSV
ncbi:mucin-2-like isoform X1 [Tribolium madens]|uniref:mucin-2-like isoform X1 n=1 Tax=Tribolium madens TaxID=41895 RepID=UPI001CF73D1F|nr:mucin-2-like isoform X1 [Tribolium madens]XP_044255734.1 mucin-2-like isoform X1 [Tribolium madens]